MGKQDSDAHHASQQGMFSTLTFHSFVLSTVTRHFQFLRFTPIVTTSRVPIESQQSRSSSIPYLIPHSRFSSPSTIMYRSALGIYFRCCIRRCGTFLRHGRGCCFVYSYRRQEDVVCDLCSRLGGSRRSGCVSVTSCRSARSSSWSSRVLV
jgi:hypothetical protein